MTEATEGKSSYLSHLSNICVNTTTALELHPVPQYYITTLSDIKKKSQNK